MAHLSGTLHLLYEWDPRTKVIACATRVMCAKEFVIESDSMRHARDVCEGICNRMIPHFSYYCKYGILVFGDDGTGPADASKMTKRVEGWSRQIMGGGFYYLQYYYNVK